LHGEIIADEGLNAIHPDYGRHEYNEILVYLASSGGQIVSEIQTAGTDPIAYAETAAVWINHLLDHGVPPKRIFVIGFSKGEAITIHLSDLLKNPCIYYVMIGICGDEIKANSQIKLYGRILPLFETSDPLGGS